MIYAYFAFRRKGGRNDYVIGKERGRVEPDRGVRIQRVVCSITGIRM